MKVVVLLLRKGENTMGKMIKFKESEVTVAGRWGTWTGRTANVDIPPGFSDATHVMLVPTMKKGIWAKVPIPVRKVIVRGLPPDQQSLQ